MSRAQELKRIAEEAIKTNEERARQKAEEDWARTIATRLKQEAQAGYTHCTLLYPLGYDNHAYFRRISELALHDGFMIYVSTRVEGFEVSWEDIELQDDVKLNDDPGFISQACDDVYTGEDDGEVG